MFRHTLKTATLFALTFAIAAMSFALNLSANEDAYNKTLRSTAWIIAGNSSGTAVVVDAEKKLLITNFHVTSTQQTVKVIFPTMQGNRVVGERDYYKNNLDKLAIAGNVVAYDKQRDLAIVQVEKLPAGTVAIEFGEASRPGQSVHSIGNPGASKALWIYTFGKVRQNYYRKGKYSFGTTQMQMLETDAPINHGDSGGPIVNDAGELVGISQGMSNESRLYSWGVDITEVRWYLKKYNRTLAANGATTPNSTGEQIVSEQEPKAVAGSFKDLPMFDVIDGTK